LEGGGQAPERTKLREILPGRRKSFERLSQVRKLGIAARNGNVDLYGGRAGSSETDHVDKKRGGHLEEKTRSKVAKTTDHPKTGTAVARQSENSR